MEWTDENTESNELATAYLIGAEHMRERLHKQAEVIEAQAKRIEELEHQLKVECDTYLWNRKLLSRRIASLQYWMKKLFQYASSPEAKRNQMTMTTEIPDYLMREGEDILHHIDERSDLEKGSNNDLGEKDDDELLVFCRTLAEFSNE